MVDDVLIKEWRTAVYNSANGCNSLVNAFKINHPNEYKLFNAMYRKRTELNRDCAILQDLGLPVYWITLTFNNDKDLNKIESKRKEAQRMLNDIAVCYVIVEEYGEENDRYHIHGFLSFKLGYGFQDFIEWHSRQKIELLEGSKIKRKVRYLTNYLVKQVPRIRRSKTLQRLRSFTKNKGGLRRCFPDVYKDKLKNYFANETFPI